MSGGGGLGGSLGGGGGGLGGGRVHRCSVVGCSREYKTRSQLMRHAVQTHGITLRPGSPRPIMKTRNAFFLHTSLATRIMRRLCIDIVQPRKLSRNPTWPINPANVRQESLHRLGGRSFDDLAPLVKSGTGKRTGKVGDVSIRLGQNDRLCPGWMLPTDPNRIPKQPHIAYPKPPKGPDGSLIYTPVPNREITTINSSSTLLKRRAYEETNGMDGLPPHKKPCKDPGEALDSYHLSQLGVNPPPGLTVTPVGLGVNGGPGITPTESTVAAAAATPPPLPTQLPPPQTQTPLPLLPHQPPPPQSQSHPLPLHPQPPSPQQPLSFPSSIVAVPPTHSGGGRAKIATVSRIAGRPRIISWMDAPDDVYFYASDNTKKLRRTLTTCVLKRAARRPFRKVPCKEEPTE